MPKGKLNKPYTRTCRGCDNDFETTTSNRLYCDECRKHRTANLDEFKGEKCEVCGWPESKDLHAHHIKAKSKGGLAVAENMATLCMYCHRAVHLVRRKQNMKFTKEGLKRFKELAEACNGRITPRLAWRNR